ncbi:MAG: GC-type dockerin domain-anchored protein [Phycisphaerales bacterium]
MRLVISIGALVLAGSCGVAFGQGRMIAIDSARAMYELNMDDGTRTSIGSATTNAGTTGGLAYDCQSGTMYLTSTSLDSLFTLDVTTGQATLVGAYGDSAIVMHGLEWDSANQTLYGVSSHNNGLYTISTTTGVATLVGTSFLLSFTNLGYDSDNDIMYATNTTTPDSFHSMDLATGATTYIGDLNGPTNPHGLAYNSANHTMYIICSNTDTLYTVDLASGATTVVGALGSANYLGLAYIPESCGGGPVCVADVDDGSGSGVSDGAVTIDDLLYYLGLFQAGDIGADVDNGTGTGTTDSAVTIDDLLYFLVRFGEGC